MNHPVIKSLTELERAAAVDWWESEDRFAWRNELIRRCEAIEILPLKSCLAVIPALLRIRMWDADLMGCFSLPSESAEDTQFSTLIDELNNLEKEALYAIAPRPGFWMSEEWREQEESLRSALKKAKQSGALVVRCGFVSEQSDILMAADLGFSGIQIHAADLDLFQLQLLIELARDCRLTPVVSVEDQNQLETVLGTDAPHIALCCMNGDKYEWAIRFVQQSLPRLPHNCTKLIFSSAATETDVRLFGRLGMSGIFSFG